MRIKLVVCAAIAGVLFASSCGTSSEAASPEDTAAAARQAAGEKACLDEEQSIVDMLDNGAISDVTTTARPDDSNAFITKFTITGDSAGAFRARFTCEVAVPDDLQGISIVEMEDRYIAEDGSEMPTLEEKYEAAMTAAGVSATYDIDYNICYELLKSPGPQDPNKVAAILRDKYQIGDPAAVGSNEAKHVTAMIPVLCESLIPALELAASGVPVTVPETERPRPKTFGNGKYLVGQNIEPGTYRTTANVSDCYWELPMQQAR